MQIPVVKTPLSIIALFVALIELFLAYPVTQLEEPERLVLVLFMTAFPFFVATAFFYILWYKPKNLYSPGEIAEAEAVKRRLALDQRVADLEAENKLLRQEPGKTHNALVGTRQQEELAAHVEDKALAGVKAIEKEVGAALQAAGPLNDAAVQEVKREVKRSREQAKQQAAEWIRVEMARFRDWLRHRQFDPLPELPKIVVEPPDVVNAYFNPADDSAHFGALIAKDSDTIAHTYFHSVLLQLGVLSKFAGETGGLVEGLCDYFACSFNDDPRLGEEFAQAAQLPTRWIRNLEEVVTLKKAGPEPHTMGLVFSGACWALRQRHGAEKVDEAVRQMLGRLGDEAKMSEAAKVLKEELIKLTNDKAGREVDAVFEERGVKVKP